MMTIKSKYTLRKWPFLVGTLFLLAAGALFLWNRSEDRAAQMQSEDVLQQLHETLSLPGKIQDQTENFLYIPNGVDMERYVPDYILNPDIEMPTSVINGNTYIGMLYFPSLAVELPVLSNWNYDYLKISPCLYSGSIYSGNAVIAAHNYTCHFGQLFNLLPGDTVQFTDIDGNVFTYEIVIQEVLDPTAIEDMTQSEYELSLFTCTLGGASRFTVRCRPL